VAIGIGIGAITALLGALHSRPTMSIFMLAIGAVLGSLVPIWAKLPINHPATISIGAISFGLLGFALHRICVAVALGVLIAGVSSAIFFDETRPMDKPAVNTVQVSNSLSETVSRTWESASPTFRTFDLWVALGSLVTASLLGYIFPRFGMAAFYSLGGTLLTLASIRLGHASADVKWLESFKTGPMTTALFGFCMLLVGFMTQIALLYRNTRRSADPADLEATAWR
jgi:hypothetical protein